MEIQAMSAVAPSTQPSMVVVSKKYQCSSNNCGYTTNKLFNFQRHKKIHEKKRLYPLDSPDHSSDSPSSKIQRLDIECAHADCTYRGDQLEDYVDHVHSAHNPDLKFVDKRFDDRESLENYLRRLQEHSSCSMILSRQLDGGPTESFELCCSTSGRFRRRRCGGGDNGTTLESSGDFRSGIFCSFYLAINVYDSAIYVKGCESHFGHDVVMTPAPSTPLSLAAAASRVNPLAAAAAAAASMLGGTTKLDCLALAPPPLVDSPLHAAAVAELTQSALHGALAHVAAPVDNSDEATCTDEEEQKLARDEQADEDDDERDDRGSTDFNSELRRMALDIQVEIELFAETADATLTSAEFSELEHASASILDMLRASRTRRVQPRDGIAVPTAVTRHHHTPPRSTSAVLAGPTPTNALVAASQLLTPPTSSMAASSSSTSAVEMDTPLKSAALDALAPHSHQLPPSPPNGGVLSQAARLQQLLHQHQVFQQLQQLQAAATAADKRPSAATLGSLTAAQRLVAAAASPAPPPPSASIQQSSAQPSLAFPQQQAAALLLAAMNHAAGGLPTGALNNNSATVHNNNTSPVSSTSSSSSSALGALQLAALTAAATANPPTAPPAASRYEEMMRKALVDLHAAQTRS